ncbi:MAG: sigma-E factor negative regulatory protein [Woeseiaceae bacterium]|nr:sigma-E factor negative regulatory protein [Woeseiaceae bacterium]
MNDTIKTQISAFVDGELPDAEADLLLRRMSQDATLRRQAAEYLEIGRAMRGEAAIPGIEHLQERIAAALEDKEPSIAEAIEEPAPSRAVRPLVGMALAASVALLALVGLQFTGGAPDAPVAGQNTLAETAEDSTYTVPPAVNDELEQYLQIHDATASELGANGMNSRLVNLRLSSEVVEEDDAEGEDAQADDEEAATEEDTPQP